jgi:hypothetical protein
MKLSDFLTATHEDHNVSGWLQVLAQIDPEEVQAYYDEHVPPEARQRILVPIYKKAPIPKVTTYLTHKGEEYENRT